MLNRAFGRSWFQFSLIWTIIAAAPIGRAFLFFPNFPDNWFYVYLWIIGLALCPLILLWVRYLQRKKQGWFSIIFIQFLIAVALAMAFHWATFQPPGMMRKRTSTEELEQMSDAKRFAFTFFSGSTYSVFTSVMMLSALGLLIVYNEQLRERKIQESALRENLAQTQLKVLQSELHPHFVFNTLHTVSSLMETNIEKAQKLIERLSMLLRTYLEVIDRHYYTLQEELEFIQEYVDVIQFRHTHPIKLTYNVPPALLTHPVPVLLLQPIIENSVKHGWIDRTKELLVDIIIDSNERELRITIRDNGETTTKGTATEGVGLRNLRDRLKAYYAENFVFAHESNKGYQTTLILPLTT